MIVFVYTMGKVASRNIAASLAVRGITTIHGHSLFDPLSPRATRLLSDVSDLINAGFKIRTIMLTRMPVNRNISAYFENKGNRKATQEDFLRTYPHEVPQRWFENEANPWIGLDVLKTPSDAKTRGYEMYIGERGPVLLMRVENIYLWPVAMKCLLGTQPPPLRRFPQFENRSQEYKEFRLVGADEYFKRMHSLPYAQHFYTQEELAKDV